MCAKMMDSGKDKESKKVGGGCESIAAQVEGGVIVKETKGAGWLQRVVVGGQTSVGASLLLRARLVHWLADRQTGRQWPLARVFAPSQPVVGEQV